MKKLLVFLIKLLCYAVFFTAIFGISAYGGYLYIMPSSYVTLNSSPSVRYTINYYNRVLEVNTDNEDKLTLDNLKLTHKDITDAIELTIKELKTSGVLPENEDADISISVSGKDADKANLLTEKLNNEIQISYGKYEDKE